MYTAAVTAVEQGLVLLQATRRLTLLGTTLMYTIAAISNKNAHASRAGPSLVNVTFLTVVSCCCTFARSCAHAARVVVIHAMTFSRMFCGDTRWAAHKVLGRHPPEILRSNPSSTSYVAAVLVSSSSGLLFNAACVLKTIMHGRLDA